MSRSGREPQLGDIEARIARLAKQAEAHMPLFPVERDTAAERGEKLEGL
jgi:hypothetical protein